MPVARCSFCARPIAPFRRLTTATDVQLQCACTYRAYAGIISTSHSIYLCNTHRLREQQLPNRANPFNEAAYAAALKATGLHIYHHHGATTAPNEETALSTLVTLATPTPVSASIATPAAAAAADVSIIQSTTAPTSLLLAQPLFPQGTSDAAVAVGSACTTSALSSSLSVSSSTSQPTTNLHLPLSLEYEPLTSSLSPQQMLSHYGYALIRSTPASQSFVRQLLELKLPKTGETIAGKVQQVAITTSLSEELKQQMYQLIDATVQSLGISTHDKHIVTPKILIAKPGVGQQAVHWDDWRSMQARDKFSSLLFLSDTYSTAMPRFLCRP